MHPALRVLAALALAFMVCSCSGYRNGADREAPLTLPEGSRDLFLRNVENPTMNPNLEARLRSSLRDELTRRARAMWVPRESATAYVDVTVHRFTSQTSLTGSDDQTIKSSASIELTLEVFRKSDGSRIWTADHVGYSESFSGDDRPLAEANVLDVAIRRAVDRLGQNY